MRRTTVGSSISAMTRIGPLHLGHTNGSTSSTLRMSRAQVALARVGNSLTGTSSAGGVFAGCRCGEKCNTLSRRSRPRFLPIEPHRPLPRTPLSSRCSPSSQSQNRPENGSVPGSQACCPATRKPTPALALEPTVSSAEDAQRLGRRDDTHTLEGAHGKPMPAVAANDWIGTRGQSRKRALDRHPDRRERRGQWSLVALPRPGSRSDPQSARCLHIRRRERHGVEPPI